MNEINSFTFYKNYYELIKYLPNEERLELYDSILGYMFDGKEPSLNGLSNGIWINLKMPLDTSKTNIENGKKGGRPRNTKKTETKPKQNRKETETESETETETKPKAKANNISTFYFLISNFFISNFLFLNKDNKDKLINKIKDWLKYKWEKKEYYKETGFNTLLERLERYTSQYGVDEVINLIDECMANNYKGIIFEKLDKVNTDNVKKQTAQEKRFEIYRRLEEEYDI